MRQLLIAIACSLALPDPCVAVQEPAPRPPVPLVVLDLTPADSIALYRAILGPALDSALAAIEPSRKVLYIPQKWLSVGKPALDSIRERHGVRICASEERAPCPPRHYRGMTFTQFRIVDTDEAALAFSVSKNVTTSGGVPCFCTPWLVERRLELGMWPDRMDGTTVHTLNLGEPTFVITLGRRDGEWRLVAGDSLRARLERQRRDK